MAITGKYETKVPNTVGVYTPHPSSKARNGSCFRKFVFLIFFRIPDNGQSPQNVVILSRINIFVAMASVQSAY
jgi:hypothetical protein